MRALTMLATAAAGFVMMFGADKRALADVLYSTGFEPPAYTAGLPLLGEDGWSQGGGGVVETTTVFSGTQAVGYTAAGVTGQHLDVHTVPASGQVPLIQVSDEFFVTAADPNVAWDALALFGLGGTFIAQIVVYNGEAYLDLSSFVPIGAITTGVWNDYELDLNFATGMITTFINGNLFGTAPFNAANTSLADVAIGINTGFSGTGTTSAFADNLSVTAVPEPGSLALFGTALVGLGLLGRRRRLWRRAASALGGRAPFRVGSALLGRCTEWHLR